MHTLIQKIRSFYRKSIIYSGINWRYFKGELQELDERSKILLSSYGFNIIALGLLETSDNLLLVHGKKVKCDDKHFIKLCEQYLEVYSTTQYGLKSRSVKDLINALKANETAPQMPDKYFKAELIEEASKIHGLMKIQNSQLKQLNYLRLVHTYMEIILRLTKKVPRANKIFRTILIEKENFLRSGFVIFSVALQRNGIIEFDNIPSGAKLKVEVDKESCFQFVNRTAKELGCIRSDWNKISDQLITSNTNQELISFLEELSPIIHTMSLANEGKNVFYIPCPIAYLKSLPKYLFSLLKCGEKDLDNSESIQSKIGDEIEAHIGNALQQIFKKEKIEKILEGQEPVADFYIKLNDCDLVIEVKRSIGYADTVEEIANTWRRLYKAYLQCSNSMKEYNTDTKPIIPIIIIFDDGGVTAASFQKFAAEPRLADDLGIQYIKVMSWHYLEHILSTTSVSQFVVALLKQQDNYLNNGKKIKDLIYPPEFLRDSDTPAHNYEYLQNAADELQLQIPNQNPL